MSMTKKGLIFFSALFLMIFIVLNIWIVNHSGLVRFFSVLSIRHFNYWSSTLSYGLPIILGVFTFITVFGIFYAKNIFFLNHSKKELSGQEKLHDLDNIIRQARIKLESKKMAILFLVIGLEMTVMGSIDYCNLSTIKNLAKCSAEQIGFDQCSSKWIQVTSPLQNKVPLISVEKSTRVTHYLSIKDNLPVLIKWETHRSPSIVSPFPAAITGIVLRIVLSLFVFFYNIKTFDITIDIKISIITNFKISIQT